jgi:hypothetical protein
MGDAALEASLLQAGYLLFSLAAEAPAEASIGIAHPPLLQKAGDADAAYRAMLLSRLTPSRRRSRLSFLPASGVMEDDAHGHRRNGRIGVGEELQPPL